MALHIVPNVPSGYNFIVVYCFDGFLPAILVTVAGNLTFFC